MSHTPGPWSIVPTGTSVVGQPLCNVVKGNALVAEFCVEDDARLIAACPDLIAALRAFVEQRNKLAGFPQAVDPYSGAYVAAQAAIAKAEGKQ